MRCGGADWTASGLLMSDSSDEDAGAAAAETADAELKLPHLALSNQVFDIAFSPVGDVIAAGTIDGRLTL